MQRFEDALRGEPQDRVPVFPLVGSWVAANFSEFPVSQVALASQLIVEAQIRAKQSIGYDPLYVYVDALYVPEAFGCTVRFLNTGPLLDPLLLFPYTLTIQTIFIQ